MILAHGTKAFVAQRAHKDGLLPRGRLRKSHYDKAPSRNDCVYLTAAYAHFYAMNASADGNVGLVEVDPTKLDEEKMLPDEDAIAQLLKHDKEFEVYNLIELTRRVRRNLRMHATTFSYVQSLRTLGNMAYQGRIPPEAIKRVVIYSIEGWHTMLSDPTISLMNFKVMGTMYMELQKLWLGRPHNLRETDVWANAREPGHWDRIEEMVSKARIITYDRG